MGRGTTDELLSCALYEARRTYDADGIVVDDSKPLDDGQGAVILESIDDLVAALLTVMVEVSNPSDTLGDRLCAALEKGAVAIDNYNGMSSWRSDGLAIQLMRAYLDKATNHKEEPKH